MAYDYIEFTEYHSPDGQVYRFETGDKFLMSVTGMGMPGIRYITQQAPFQHGNTILDYRLEPRVIQLVHRRNACSRQDYWDSRADLLNFIRPNRQTLNTLQLGKLRKKFPNGDKRDIDVLIEQGPVFQPRNPNQWDEWGFTETLRFIAPDPTFYDPDQESEVWVLDSGDHLVFEADGAGTEDLIFTDGVTGVGLIFGYSVINDSVTIAYDGTWHTYPNIDILGPLSGFAIRNETLDLEIALNYDISAGETVQIVLQPGYKQVTSSLHGNIIGTVAEGSDLSTFRIAPDPEAPGGNNVLTVVGVTVDANTDISVCWYNRYIGI